MLYTYGYMVIIPLTPFLGMYSSSHPTLFISFLLIDRIYLHLASDVEVVFRRVSVF
jgi:hypothetical protein